MVFVKILKKGINMAVSRLDGGMKVALEWHYSGASVGLWWH